MVMIIRPRRGGNRLGGFRTFRGSCSVALVHVRVAIDHGRGVVGLDWRLCVNLGCPVVSVQCHACWDFLSWKRDEGWDSRAHRSA
jgi:hypothetical protein